MRVDFYLENEKEETKLKNLLNLKNEKASLREEIALTQKDLDFEEERNFKINKRFFKINSVILLLTNFSIVILKK